MAILSLDGVSKTFRRAKQPAATLKEATLRLLRGGTEYEQFEALRDVSFTVERGEAFALVGANGSGKSTLLKIISAIIAPTKGSVERGGRISPLIELSAGFHPELTGIENVYLNGAVHGMSRSEVAQKLPAIEAFADIGDFVHSPIRTYSSGMLARLGFALAINVDADILLVDEVLSVGDHRFRRKCVDHIHRLKSDGVTLLYVSHNLDSTRELCDRALLLEKGRAVACGDPDEIVERYTGEKRVAP